MSEDLQNPFAAPRAESVADADAASSRRVAREIEQAMTPVLRKLEFHCTALGFLFGLGSLLPLAWAGYDFYEYAQGGPFYLPIMESLVGAIGLSLFLLGAAIHLRQVWAVWIAIGLSALYLVAQLSTLNLCGISLGLLLTAVPLTLCMNIRRLAAELRAAGIPPTAELTKNGIEW
jgi:hypothetical protein